MSAETLPQPYTFEEFCEAIEDGQKADLIDGVIYMASPDSLRNNKLATFLSILLEGYARKRVPGEVYVSRVAFKLGKRSGPEPDVSFLRSPDPERLKHGHVVGGPDLVIEIVSPDSVERDYIRKRVLYEQAGIPEYWIIDPDRRRITPLVLTEAEYHEASVEESIVRSAAVPGFWIDAEWLYSANLPDPFECLNQILADELREGDHA